MNREKVFSLIENLKASPGVYLMKDNEDRVIYVGKAKNLQKRVSQYFLRPQNGKVQKMVNNVDNFETIITENEKEAFILEYNLVQKYMPRYNVLLKDGKHYPYIALKNKDDPYLKIARHRKDKNYSYFGPFPTSSNAFNTIDLLNKIFSLRKCKNIPSKPCLYYHLGQCLGPCVKKINEEEIQPLINKINRFLSGNNKDTEAHYKKLMIEASKKQDYERAEEYKKILLAIKDLNNKQNVDVKNNQSRDIFAYAQRDGYLSLAVLLFRNGILLGKELFIVEEFGEINELLISLIVQFYHTHEIPKEIVINVTEIKRKLMDVLNTKVCSYLKGSNLKLIQVANLNAQNGLDEHFLSARIDDDKMTLLDRLGSLLNIKTPYRIELFDNSHLQGSNPVGALVVFINGEKVKNMYRKYHIEDSDGKDDLKSMYEIVYRRYSRLIEEKSSFPDLVLVDGSIEQLKIAKKALHDLNIDIPIFSLSKNEKHQTKELVALSGDVITLENDQKLFFLLTRMQDEVHRYAISFHKVLRNKKMYDSIFDGIKGLGKKRQERILQNYQSLFDLKNASIDELSQILPNDIAKNLYQKLHL